ncbi:MAG: extensin family protein [Blastomonas sp.]
MDQSGTGMDATGNDGAPPDSAAANSAGFERRNRSRGEDRVKSKKRDSRFTQDKSSPENQRKALVAALAALLGGCGMVPAAQSGGAPPPRPSMSAGQSFAQGPAASQCLTDLGLAKASFTPLPDQYLGGGCTQLGSVRLSRINLSASNAGGADLAIANLGPVTCPLARTFTGWAQYGVARAAEQMLGSTLVRIETFGSYNCRTIAGSAKLSEHAHANAIDVSAFVLADGRRISVKNGWSGGTTQERAFLRAVQKSACRRFGTVLSPDYNAAHHDHLHLDMSAKPFCR